MMKRLKRHWAVIVALGAMVAVAARAGLPLDGPGRAAPAGEDAPGLLDGGDGPPPVKVTVGVQSEWRARGLVARVDGNPDGFVVRVTEEALKLAGMTGEFVDLPPTPDGMDVLESGRIRVLAPLSILDERLHRVNFTAPLVIEHGAVFTRTGVAEVHTMDELRDQCLLHRARVVAASEGAGQAWCIANEVPFRQSGTLLAALREVSEGTADYAVTTLMAGTWQVERSKLKGLAGYRLEDDSCSRAFALATRASDHEMVAKLNQGIAKLRENGEFDRLYDEWVAKYQPRETPPVVPQRVLGLVIGAGVGLLAVALAALGAMYGRLRRHARALSDSEGTLRRITDGLDEVVWLRELKSGRLLFVSPAYERLFGLSCKGLMEDSSSWRRAVHEDDARRIGEVVEKSEAAGTGYDLEYRVRRPDASVVWVHDRAVPIQNARGRTEYLAGVARDVTEGKRTRDELREREGHYREILECMNDALLVFDPAGETILAVNARACEMYGYPETELVGKSLEEMSLHIEIGKRRIAETLEHGRHDGFTTRHRRSDGAEIDVEIRSSVINYRGRPAILSMNRDVTEKVRAEEDRRRLDEQLMQTQKLESLGVLAGGMAHDFNNLLVGVLGHAGLALRNLPEDSVARKSVEQIELAATRAADLTKNMLAYAGKGRLSMRLADVSALAVETAGMVRGSITPTASLRLELHDHLPLVECDAAQVRQVVMNLILNASDAVKEKPGSIVVKTGRARVGEAERAGAFPAGWMGEGEFVFLEVRDDGCGIAPEILPRIFDPFFTTKFTGRGLGLAATLGIIRVHDGAIMVDSAVGRGTTIRVLFPAAAAGATAEPEGLMGPMAAPPAARGTVLVVDDEAIVRDLAETALTRAGFGVVMAADGAEAIRVIRDEPGSIRGVLLDLTMPDVTGERVLAELNRLRPDLPVVMMSGFTEDEVAVRLAGMELKSFLHKPFTIDDLVAAAAGLVE